jgi:S-formylglutathione hydrolase
MKFAAYLPTHQSNEKLPVIIWLSGSYFFFDIHNWSLCIRNYKFIEGLTCNEQNFITKSGFQRLASKHRIIVVCPDTSPSKLKFCIKFI